MTVRYDFAADGNVRQLTGIPEHIETVVRRGRAVVYRYRMSHWIAASALMVHSGAARRRTDSNEEYAKPNLRSEAGLSPMSKLAAGVTAIDPFPA